MHFTKRAVGLQCFAILSLAMLGCGSNDSDSSSHNGSPSGVGGACDHNCTGTTSDNPGTGTSTRAGAGGATARNTSKSGTQTTAGGSKAGTGTGNNPSTGNTTGGNRSSAGGNNSAGGAPSNVGGNRSTTSGGAGTNPNSTARNNVGGVAAAGGTNPGAVTGGATSIEFVVPGDAKETPIDSGIKGAFRVNTSTGKLMHNGTPFQVRGGNWFGLEGQDDIARPGAMELYIGAVFWAAASDMRDIATTMKEIQQAPLGLNTIRLPVAPQTLIPGHEDGLYSRTDVKIRNNDPAHYAYGDAYEALVDFIKQAAQNNLYIILDIHSCSNHIGWRAGKIDDGPPWTDANRENYKYKKEDYYCNKGPDAYDKAKWLADVHTLAKLPKQLGVNNIIGIDCFNEPFKYSWSDWSDLAKECYDAMAAENDDLIAVVEGVSSTHIDAAGTSVPEPFGSLDTNPNWGENLYGQKFDPIQIPKDRLCFSPHTYGPAVYVQKQFVDQTQAGCAGLEDDAAGKAKCKLIVDRSNSDAVALLRKGWDDHFGYLADNHYCVIVGEFGGYKDWPSNPVKPSAATVWAHLPSGARPDWEWQNIFVDYLVSKGLTDFTYWSINPESGDTGGLYNHAYSLSNESGWGVWKGLDTEKANMLGRLK